MELYINNWKARGAMNSTPFLLNLGNPRKSYKEKKFIVDILDDWRVITSTWFQMARHFRKIEELSTDKDFPGKPKAALLCSKVAYCQELYNTALNFALNSGNQFNLTPTDDFHNHDSLYVNKIIEEALDTYKQQRNQKVEADPELSNLVDRIFQQNLQKKDFAFVIGLALDTRRIDMVEATIGAQGTTESTLTLTETLNRVWESQLDVEFRDNVLDLIFRLFEGQTEPNFVSMCQCLMKLERHEQMAQILEALISKDRDLMLYQLAFDLYENAPQKFLDQLKQCLFDSSEEYTGIKMNLRKILNGEETIKHHMQFLIKNNRTDMLILRQIKDAARGGCTQNGTVIANGLMHWGTTCDDFLRENLEWISKATNWNKFNAVASLGLIHKGHEHEAKKLLEPYLPKGDQDQFGYKEGGSLYAYGLIHANHGNTSVINYLSDELNKATTSAVRHGACLGLGLAALGTRNTRVYEQLRDILYQAEAVSGEAAGIAMGLVMAGSMHNEAFDEMSEYITETQHDKIQRGLRTGIAILAYGAMENAEVWISKLESNSSEAILRQTAVCMMGMAYVGTGNAEAIQRLLVKVAADPSNDVKRFAAIAIGFVLSGNAEQCLGYAKTLIEHFNGHVRYGAAISMAISCAGSGYRESIALLEPLLQAKENYVRQGASIALAFILIQHTAPTCANVVEFRKNILKITTEKGEDTITKFGAVVAQGILDAGGRNVTLSLHNRSGQPDMPAVIGTFVFLQHFYWHSLTHFISLAFRPTCIIGLNKNLKMPKIDFRCNAKPSLFAYPPPLEEKKKEESEKVETAVLSITNKKKSQASAKKKEDENEKKENNEPEKMDVDLEEKENRPKEVPEPLFHTLPNPTRAVRLQLRTLAMPESARYRPMKPIGLGGIIMFQDQQPDKEEEIVELATAGGLISSDETKWTPAAPHTAFEFTMSDY